MTQYSPTYVSILLIPLQQIIVLKAKHFLKTTPGELAILEN